MTGKTEWRLHVGAHKTATTHLQNALAAQRAALRKAGVDYIPTDELRRLGWRRDAGRFGWRLALGGLPMRRRLERGLVPLRGGPGPAAPVTAISEENLLGLSTGLLDWPFYPGAERPMRTLDALAGGGALTLFLSVRGFAGLLPSAYAQVLRTRTPEGGFEPIRRKALDRPPSWAGLADRVAAAAPRAALRIWTFEDYRVRGAEIRAAFCGVDLPGGAEAAAPERTRSPSARAIARLEALAPGMDREARRAAVDRILAEDDDEERFAPFSPSETALLDEAYAEDLDRLVRRRPDAPIAFGPAPAPRAEAI